MRMKMFGICAAMSLSMFALGCDESATPKMENAADKAANKMDAAADKAANSMDGAADKAANSMGNTMDAAKDSTAKMADAAKEKGAAAVDAAKEAGADMMATAQKLFDDAKAAITKGDLEGATKYVDQLKGWQDKLPADWKAKVDEVVKMLADAKEKLKMVPGMPK